MMEDTIIEQGKKLKVIVEEIGKLDKQLSGLKEQRALLEEDLHDQMVDEGVQKISIEGKTFYPRAEFYASVKNKEQGFDWLKSEGLGNLIYQTVNARSLAKAMRERLEAGEPVPEALVNVTTKKRVGMRSA
jgi:hypothetical protein